MAAFRRHTGMIADNRSRPGTGPAMEACEIATDNDYDGQDCDEPIGTRPVDRFRDAFESAFAASGLSAAAEVILRGVDRAEAELYQLTVRADVRGRGHANGIMEMLTSLADMSGVELVLEPAANMDSEDRGLTQSHLETWYASWGFVPVPYGKM